MGSRTVVIMGPDACPDIDHLAHLVADHHGELCVLSIGYPLSAAQREAVDAVIEIAAEVRLACEVRMLWTADEIEDHIHDGNNVIVVPGAFAAQRAAVPSPAH